MRLKFFVFFTSFGIATFFFFIRTAVFANHEAGHGTDLVINSANYLPNQAQFTYTIRNAGNDRFTGAPDILFRFIDTQGRLMSSVPERLDLDLDAGEAQTQVISGQGGFGIGSLNSLLFKLYEDRGFLIGSPVDRLEIVADYVLNDPDGAFAETNEANNILQFREFYPEMRAPSYLGSFTPNNLQFNFYNFGLRSIAGPLIFTFEWMDGAQNSLAQSVDWVRAGALDYFGSGNVGSGVFHSKGVPAIQNFLATPPREARFVEVTMKTVPATDEMKDASDNSFILPIPAERLTDLVVESARYIPNEGSGKFTYTIKNAGVGRFVGQPQVLFKMLTPQREVMLSRTRLLPPLDLDPEETYTELLSAADAFTSNDVQALLFQPYSNAGGYFFDKLIDDIEIVVDYVPGDADGRFAEANENNNILEVRQFYPEIRIEDPIFKPDDLQFKLRNLGLRAITEPFNFTFEWLDANEMPLNQSIAWVREEDLGYRLFLFADNVFVFHSKDLPEVQNFLMNPPENAIFVKVSVIANPVIDEMENQANNVTTLPIPHMDLILESVFYSPNINGRFTYTVKNGGTWPLQGQVITVQLQLVDDQGRVMLPLLQNIQLDLQPGATFTRVISNDDFMMPSLFFPYNSETPNLFGRGIEKIRVVVDAPLNGPVGGEIAESDEKNNALEVFPLYPELGVRIVTYDQNHLEVLMDNSGLKVIANPIQVVFEWLTQDGQVLANLNHALTFEEDLPYYGYNPWLENGPGTAHEIRIDSRNFPNLHEFVMNPPLNATFIRVRAEQNPAQDEMFRKDNNWDTRLIPVALFNAAPLIFNQAFNGDEDRPINANLQASDMDQDPLTFVKLTDPRNGGLEFNADGRFTYTPNSDFYGIDGFTFKVNDGRVDSNVGTVSLAVRSVNDIPTAQDFAFTLAEDTSLSARLLAFDADGDDFFFIEGDRPAHGSLALNLDGSFIYTPEADFTGEDSFTFRATDRQEESALATITLTVEPRNDRPLGDNQVLTLDEDQVYEGRVTGEDVDADVLNFRLVQDPGAGTVQLNPDGGFVYTPFLHSNGVDIFGFTALDGAEESPVAFVMITINPVNDAPYAEDQNFVIDEDLVLSNRLAAQDAEGDPVTFSLETNAENGNIVLDPDGSFIYTPNLDFSGVDSFGFSMSDGALASEEIEVTVTVNDLLNTVATLLNLTENFEGSDFSPAFDATIFSYSLNTIQANNSVVLLPTLTDPRATLRINGNRFDASVPIEIPLPNYGPNTLTLEVAAEDGTLNTYTLMVNRIPVGGSSWRRVVITEPETPLISPTPPAPPTLSVELVPTTTTPSVTPAPDNTPPPALPSTNPVNSEPSPAVLGTKISKLDTLIENFTPRNRNRREVRELQIELQKQGYLSPKTLTNGIYGRETRKALKKYLQENRDSYDSGPPRGALKYQRGKK